MYVLINSNEDSPVYGYWWSIQYGWIPGLGIATRYHESGKGSLELGIKDARRVNLDTLFKGKEE